MEEFDNYKIYLEDKMNIFIDGNFPSKVGEQVKYMCADGKKLRGILVLIFGKSNLSDSSSVTNHIAILIEILHSVSLVLDDSPLMDNDDIRRDKPSFFKEYGTKYTFFYIYYCINKLLLDAISLSRVSSKLNIKHIVSKLDNLIIGQLLDINNNTVPDNCMVSQQLLKELELLNEDPFPNEKTAVLIDNIKLNIYKTGSLFSLAIDLPQDLHDTNIKISDSWSLMFGLLFQYSDDYLDLDQDIINDKPNVCKILDKPNVKKIIINGCNKLKLEINKIDINKVVLKYILDKIRSRVC